MHRFYFHRALSMVYLKKRGIDSRSISNAAGPASVEQTEAALL